MTQLTDIQYYGSVYYYISLLNNKYIIFDNTLSHFKGLHVNRTCILGANKVLTLSVPLEGGRSVKHKIMDLKIASRDSWQRIHWRSIHDSYRKAPWFEEYAVDLENLYQKTYVYLWDWNLKIAEWVFQSLNSETVILSEEVSGNLQNSKISFSNDSIKMGFGYPKYQQVFSDKLGFQPNLSILDLIMNEGPMARKYLEKLEVYEANRKDGTMVN
jgi:hypothetical protein